MKKEETSSSSLGACALLFQSMRQGVVIRHLRRSSNLNLLQWTQSRGTRRRLDVGFACGAVGGCVRWMVLLPDVNDRCTFFVNQVSVGVVVVTMVVAGVVAVIV